MLALVAAPVMGQSDESEQINGTLIVESGLQITVDVNNVDFGTVNPNDVSSAAGSPDVVISTSANVQHDIQIIADDPDMTTGSPATKPMSDIEWSIDGTNWFALSDVTPGDVDTNIAAGVHSNNWTLQHRVSIDTDDEPATYEGSWTLTVVASS